MKTKIKILSIILSCLLIIIASSDARQSAKTKAGKEHTIDNINLPQIKTLNTDNGLRVFYINDELPRVIIVLSAGYGKLYETSANAGVSDLLADTLSLAGSNKYPSDILHNTIESIGGVFSIQTSYEETQIIVEVIEKHADLAFDIVRDIVLNPNLDAKYIEKARSLLLEDVRRKGDDPATLAFDKAKEIIFNGNGYGAYPTEKSLNSITADDLSGILGNYFTAKNIIIGIAGPKSLIDVKENLKGFGALKEGAVMNYSRDSDALVASLAKKSENIYLLPKDIPQAAIVAGTIAPAIKDAGLYPLSLMNDILGGSDFNSRLMQEIRVKRGLAYAVQSVIRARKNTGVFLAYAQTRFESADTALSLMLENIEQMSAKPVNNPELKLAKEAVKNSYIFEFDTPAAILKKYSFLSYNGLPESFLFDYVKRMEKVTKEEIQKSSRALFGKGLVKVVVGRKELEKSLSKFGKVVIVE